MPRLLSLTSGVPAKLNTQRDKVAVNSRIMVAVGRSCVNLRPLGSLAREATANALGYT